MDENEKLNRRVVELEKENKQLKRAVEQLMRRLSMVEKQARTAYNRAHDSDNKISQLNYALRELSRKILRREI